ncbi:hypothetical protein [Hymenobacter sp. BT559]|jgi:hypothetical protein|uniref:hypothetical protein n=1 Tax=Hymenobacter sp. BT559 TaxID=2795729 RepID=UPI0018ED8504|nr:hypothetical protein [Hymenobacter sp. BT559]MBJ6145748.1 hypothetical protein [Hymenobacter sp. BT559]
MPRITSPRQHIRILLPDIVLGGTRIKQVGFVIEQNWTQPLSTGEVSGVIVVRVKRYAFDESQPEGLGPELAEFNPRQPVRLIGTNDTLLYANNGEVALQRTTESPDDWQAAIEAKAAEAEPRPVILQGDGLELIREQPTVITAEIIRHLQAAPAYHWAPKDEQGQPILPHAPDLA